MEETITETEKKDKTLTEKNKTGKIADGRRKGKFNENNKFETTTEDSKLNFNNEWDYKGKFKDGQFCDKGKITWKDGKTLEGYFKNNRVMGHIKINFKNISIEANMKENFS